MTNDEWAHFKRWFNNSGWSVFAFLPMLIGCIVLIVEALVIIIPPAGGIDNAPVEVLGSTATLTFGPGLITAGRYLFGRKLNERILSYRFDGDRRHPHH